MRTIALSAAFALLAASARAQEAAAPAPAAAAPRTHTVVKHDCLWELAKTYYNNPHRWKVIYSANTEKIKDPHWIYPGQVFVIPDVPGPEIGEVGARPVETGAKVTVPVETEAPAPAPKPEPQVAPEPPAVAAGKGEENITEDLSVKFPKGLTGSSTMTPRVIRPKGWTADGKITEFEGREGAVAQGDSVHGRLGKKQSASEGDRFVVYRRDSVKELDEDKDAVYLVKIGVVQVTKALGKSSYAFIILQSGDSVQLGDWLAKEGS